jgi:hypothetical protein
MKPAPYQKKGGGKMKKLVAFLVVAALLLAGVGCGGGSNSSSTKASGVGGTPSAGSNGSNGNFAGAWDFTIQDTTSGNNNLTAVEAVLTQSGTSITGSGTVGASGPAGTVWAAKLNAASLASVTEAAFEIAGAQGCNGIGNGTTSITGSISGNTVTLVFNDGGNKYDVTGTISGNPATFSGTYKAESTNAAGCNTDQGTVTGMVATNLNGAYSGSDNKGGTATVTLTENSNGNLTATGSDSNNGNLSTVSGPQNIAVGNAMSITIQFSGGNHPNTPQQIYGYFDPQVEGKGSLILMQLDTGQQSCDSPFNGWCPVATLARQ